MGRLREGKKKRKGERERKVGKLFCAPLLVSLKLGCTGTKRRNAEAETQLQITAG